LRRHVFIYVGVVGLLHAGVVFADVAPGAVADPAAPPAEAPTAQIGAAEPADNHAAERGDPLADDELAKPRKQRKKIEVGGRVFARTVVAKAEGAPDATAQTTLQSARLGVDYRARDLRAQVEVEVADKAKIKDAFVQLRLADAPKLVVRAGNFKIPFSAIQRESIWTLPMADRGLVDNVLVKRLQVAGRAVGAMVAVELGGPVHPTIRAGVFQGRNDVGEPLSATAEDGLGHDAVLRVSIEPATGIEVGVAGSVRSGALIEVPVEIRRAYAGEVDVTIDRAAGPGRVRAWVEGMIGTSWIVGMEPGHELTRFLEARGILAYRLGGERKRARYVEPYALAAVLDPDRIFDRDLVREVAAGLTYGASDVWRIQLEAEAWRFGDNAPLGIAEFAVASVDSTTVLVQLGARF